MAIAGILAQLFLTLSAATAEPLDAALATIDAGDNTHWYSIRHLEVEGKGWTDTKAPFDRLPAKAEGVVRDAVWKLSRNSAGMCVRFTTDSPWVQVRWTLTGASLAMSHMPATGVSGVDLYAKTPAGAWHWLACGQPKQPGTNQPSS